MINLATERIDIISSIPGRIRLNIGGVFKHEIFGYKIVNILKKLKGIKNISFSKYTGNLLILYDYKALNETDILNYVKSCDEERISNSRLWSTKEDSIVKIVLQGLNPLNFIGRRYPMKAYKDEYRLSKRLMKTGLVFGGLLLAAAALPMNILSVGILSYPGILFSISSAAYYFIARISNYHDVYIRNNQAVGMLGKTREILIEDEVLLKDTALEKSLIYHQQDRETLQRLVILKEIENPVDFQMKEVIKRFRRYGVTNIHTYSENPNALGDYLAYYLGISRIDEKDFQEMDKENDAREDIVALISNEDIRKDRSNNFTDIHIKIHSKILDKIKDADIHLLKMDRIKIPQVLRLSQIAEDIITRSHVIAITINIIALFLTLVGKIHPIMALGIYGLNLLIQLILLQYNMEIQKGVMLQ